MKKLVIITMCAAVFFQLSCKENMLDNPSENQKPKTYLWLYPGPAGIDSSVSRQHLHWWGEDPDGVVRGFLFAFDSLKTSSIPNPDTLRYNWVLGNDTLILFPLRSRTKDFTVFVRSADNTFPGLRSAAEWARVHPERPFRSIIRLGSSPYWDENDNGRFDSLDEALPAIRGAMDPIGAVQTFPIRNTRPSASFANNPNDGTLLKQPDTTFTAVTFAWTAEDDDGNNTLSSYRIALNDTLDPSRWLTIPLRDTLVTLVVRRQVSDTSGSEVTAEVYAGKFVANQASIGTVPGLRLDALNTLYLQVKDVAGEYSPTIRMPSGTDTWFVRRPRGKLLIVSDDVNYGIAADAAYRNALAGVPGGDFAIVDRLNIGLGLTANDKLAFKYGRLMPPFFDPTLIRTFLLYDYVLWYTEQYPSLIPAQLSLFPYVQNGGKLIFSTTFLNTSDPRNALRDFAPIDSVSSVDLAGAPPPPRLGDTRLPGNLRVVPDSSDPSNIYPALAFNAPSTQNYTVYMRPIYRRTDARYIYHLQADPRTPVRYSGAPDIAVVDGQRTNIFVGLPLHFLDNRDPQFGNANGLTAFFTKALTQTFSRTQHINRRKF